MSPKFETGELPPFWAEPLLPTVIKFVEDAYGDDVFMVEILACWVWIGELALICGRLDCDCVVGGRGAGPGLRNELSLKMFLSKWAMMLGKSPTNSGRTTSRKKSGDGS
jgi:hypothetical protein